MLARKRKAAELEKDQHTETAEDAVLNDAKAEDGADQPEDIAEDAITNQLEEGAEATVSDDGATEGVVGTPVDVVAAETLKTLCAYWLRHPTTCVRSDNCPHAHGLFELGLDEKAVVIRCSPGAEAVNVFTEPVAGALRPSAVAGSGKLRPRLPAPANPGKGWGAWTAQPAWTPGGHGGKPPAAQWALPQPEPQPAWAQQLRFGKGGFRPTKICTFWLLDPVSCRRGTDCSFAHGVHELREDAVDQCGVSRFHHLRMPTKMCTFFTNNACTKGLACTFAHGEDELVMGGFA